MRRQCDPNVGCDHAKSKPSQRWTRRMRSGSKICATSRHVRGRPFGATSAPLTIAVHGTSLVLTDGVGNEPDGPGANMDIDGDNDRPALLDDPGNADDGSYLHVLDPRYVGMSFSGRGILTGAVCQSVELQTHDCGPSVSQRRLLHGRSKCR